LRLPVALAMVEQARRNRAREPLPNFARPGRVGSDL
jgi:hypothetical protein